MKLLLKTALCVLLCALLITGALFVRSSGPGGNGVLARLEAADGSTYLVTQEWNDWFEPYTVSFFVRGSDGGWGWCYIDHQSGRLNSANLQFDEGRNCVRVFADGELRAEYLKTGSEFSLLTRDGRAIRTVSAPQEWRAPPF